MNKDFNLKKDPSYHTGQLRSRINSAIKQLRDEADETKHPEAKTLPVIPVTGSGGAHKYFNNKTDTKF